MEQGRVAVAVCSDTRAGVSTGLTSKLHINTTDRCPARADDARTRQIAAKTIVVRMEAKMFGWDNEISPYVVECFKRRAQACERFDVLLLRRDEAAYHVRSLRPPRASKEVAFRNSDDEDRRMATSRRSNRNAA